MGIFRLHILLFFMAFITMAAPIFSATEFIADEVNYDNPNGTVYVVGNVEIKNEIGYFYLEKLIYDIDSEQITVQGRVRAVLSSGEKFIANYAEIDQKNQQIILGEAKIWLTNKMQITAQNAYDTPRETYGENIVATTCRVCRLNPTPIWQIRAAQVIRDKDVQKIFFRNAWVDIFGIPMGYLPALRIPGPDAKRMEGFLPAKLIFSNLFITGVKFPYYWAFGDYADLTATAYLTTTHVRIGELEYRQNFKGGQLRTTGAYAINDGQSTNGRYYLTNQISMDLPHNFKLNGKITHQSDYDFIPEFNYSNPSTDYLELMRVSNQHFFQANAINYRPQSEAKIDAETPLVMPSASYQYYRTLDHGALLSFDLSFLALDRDLSKDIMRAAGGFELQQKSVLTFGFEIESTIGARYRAYEIGNDPIGENGNASRFTPYGAIDFSLPLVKLTDQAQHLLTPRFQLVWSENYDQGVDIPNTDSQFVEHDFISLFTQNRFVGEDRHESGLRANFGLSYAMHQNNGNSFELGVGGIWRLSGNDALDGFDETPAESVGFINYTNTGGWASYARGSFNRNFKFSRSEIGISYQSEKLNSTLEWVSLAPEPEIGFDDYRNEVLFDGRYHFHPNWEAKWILRHNLVNLDPIDAELTLTYGNECVEFNAGVVLDFSREPGIAPETRYEFEIDLLGLSKPTNDKWATSACYQ